MSGNRAPTVTIVLPAYVRTDFLRHAIRSALAQRYGDFVLSIGDNSTERCAERIVREFDDPRIEYVAHPRNLGAQGNWFSLIERARTPLVATLHDDDAWHEDFLQRLVPPMLEDPELAMSFGDFDLIDSNGAALPEATAALSAKTRRDRLPEGRIDMDREMALRMVAVWMRPIRRSVPYCAVTRCSRRVSRRRRSHSTISG
ncbi:MAG: glycosyltransferase family 2 protein [Burkholderiaceae bacterium]